MTDAYENEEETGFVETALAAADAGNAGHWPTVAGYLADEVRRLRSELEALKPVVVDRAVLIAEREGENALGPWLEEVFSTDEDSISWEQASQALFDLGAVREAQVPTLSAVKAAIRTGLGGDTEEGCGCESHICSAADAVLAALYPKATEGKS